MQSGTADENALIAAALGGDVASYEELVRRYQGLAYRVAYLVVGTPEAAEDATQEAFVKAFHALGRFDQQRPWRPWLLRIVANEARNARKAAGRRASLAVRYAETLSASPTAGSPAADSPEGAVLRGERRALLLAALDGLGQPERLVISLRYFLELSEEEMAQVLRCRRGTVKSRLNRSIGKLRQVIRERFPELEMSNDR